MCYNKRQNIPTEILESAQMDGASILRVFFQFVLPLSRPILITVGLFEAFGYWNSWYHAILYISANHRVLFPLQYVLYNLQKNVEFMAANENISGAVIVNLPTETFRMAVVVLIVLPILLGYPFFRKAFLQGLTTAGRLKNRAGKQSPIGLLSAEGAGGAYRRSGVLTARKPHPLS